MQVSRSGFTPGPPEINQNEKKNVKGWLYLAVVIDLCSRKVVGWSLSHRMTKRLVISALKMAIWRRSPMLGLIFQSDRGSQYCSNDFQKFLKKHKIINSMSRKGNCWDNTVAESFFRSLKTERVYEYSLPHQVNS